ncbi:MAG: MBOAT family protein, partial [Clostridium sp.]|nr:MBOAT family protein [Clostridium sp.]
MLFSSAAFLYSFLPLTIAVYFLMPRRLKNAALLLMSLIFYAWGEPRYVVLMVLSITQGYIFARLIGKSRGTKRAKAYLIISLVLSLGMLGVFKYANFFAESFAAVFGLKIAALNIALPIGISFYTFQLISYVIDVYRADVEPQRDYVAFAAYISMFPQLIAGPIVRYSTISAEINRRSISMHDLAEGSFRFLVGLGKKVILANQLGELSAAFLDGDFASLSTGGAWIGILAYTMQIYFDFSGYSDMA